MIYEDRYNNKVPDKDRLIIGIQYEQGASIKDIAQKWGLSYSGILAILHKPEVQELREHYRDATLDGIFKVYDRNNEKINDIFDKYIEEARKNNRISETGLGELFKVFDSLMKNRVRLQELTIKAKELEIEKQKLGLEKQMNNGLIEDFFATLGNKSKDGIDLGDDVDDDVKANTKEGKHQAKLELARQHRAEGCRKNGLKNRGNHNLGGSNKYNYKERRAQKEKERKEQEGKE